MPTGLPPRPQTRPLAGCAIGSRMPFRAGLGTRTVVGGLDRIERQPPITAPSPPCSSTTAATSNQVCSIQNRCSFADLCTAQLDLVPVAPFTALERRPHRRIGDVDGCGPNRGAKRTLAISLCSGMIGSLAGMEGDRLRTRKIAHRRNLESCLNWEQAGHEARDLTCATRRSHAVTAARMAGAATVADRPRTR